MNMQAIPAPGAADGVETPPSDLVGLSECGKAIGKHKSTVSRQLKAGLFRNWGTEAEPKVSVGEVRAARATRINPAQQRSAPAKEVPAPEAAAPAATGYQAERAAREGIRRQSEELDLKERLGQILDRREVEDDFETFGRMLRERFGQGASMLILELEQLPTAQAKEARLVEAMEKLFAELADDLDSMANDAGSS